MVSLKRWIIVCLFIVWCTLCWYRYTYSIKGLGNKRTLASINTFHGSSILFTSSSYNAIKEKGFHGYCDSLKNLLKKEKQIQVVGVYYASEKNSSAFKNLGLARAHAIKKLLGSLMDTSKFSAISKLSTSTIPLGQFTAHQTHLNLKASPNAKGIRTDSLNNNNSGLFTHVAVEKNIVQGNQFVIPFDAKAIHRAQNTGIEEHISQLAGKIKHSGKSISIIGFTNRDEDIAIGRVRAWVIKKEFLTLGVPSAQLNTSNQVADEKFTSQNSKPIHNPYVIITY